MKVLDTLFGNYTKDLSNALGRATKRNSVLAQNMANVNVPGYKRKDMELGITLSDDTSGFGNHLQQWQAEEQAQKQGDASIRIDGNSVDLEKETFAIAETELRYQMLSDMTNKYFSMMKTVIREGK